MNLNRCLNMQKKARRLIPGMTQLLSKRPDMFSEGVWPAYYKKAQGVDVWDLDDNRYVDMSIGGIGANVLGYADPDVNSAVMAAVESGSSCSLNCPEEVMLAELLCELHPWADMVRLPRTGGESMAVAVRIARAYTRRNVVAFCGYHGWQDWYLAANIGTENAVGEHLIHGLEPRGVPLGLTGSAYPFRYNQAGELEQIVAEHGDDLAAIVMEPIRSEQPKDDFLQRVRDLADKVGAVLIVDEISAGFRMNTGGAHLELGIAPDLAVFSKALGNGYPIGAVVGRGHIMAAAQDTFISSTMWTERIGPAAALATIEKHRRVDAGSHLMAMGNRVQQGWLDSAESHGLDIDVGGIAPLGHFVFKDREHNEMKAFFIQSMLEKGFLASNLFYAMYAHTQEHVETYLAAVDTAFSEISHIRSSGKIAENLKGKPSAVGFKRLT
jgi:glutamate-1-semialdehyde 2,1-aminomutase